MRPVHVHTTLPEDLWAKVHMHLYSDLEGKVPKGAFQSLMIRLLNDFLNQKDTPNATEPRGSVSDEPLPPEGN